MKAVMKRMLFLVLLQVLHASYWLDVSANAATRNECGGVSFSNEGRVASPGFPNEYQNNESCKWKITSFNTNERFRLDFLTLELEQSGNFSCENDYVIIKDGKTSDALVLGKFCGTNLPKRIWTTTNEVLIEFFSNDRIFSKGFELHYVAIPSVETTFVQDISSSSNKQHVSCGGQIIRNSGEIQFPTHPSNYLFNQFCRWFIEAPDESEILLNIVDINLEKHVSCLYDYILIRNSFHDDSSILKLCGHQSDLQLYGKQFFVEFKHGVSPPVHSFKITWEFISKRDSRSPVNLQTSLDHNACRVEQGGFSGIFTSHSYPLSYLNRLSCDFIITSETNTKIQLRFTDFHLEESEECERDFLEIYDGLSKKSNLIGRYCGNEIPDVIESQSNQLYLYFQSDDENTRRGFEALWIAVDYKFSSSKSRRQTVDEKCEYILTGDEGEIQTKNYPSTYPPSTRCTWIISAGAFEEVTLTFESFKIEKHSSCRYDFVEIFDGNGKNGDNSRGRFCGADSPGVVKANENGLTVYFESDTTTQKTGFKAKWKKTRKGSIVPTECGGKMSGLTGVFTSPGYPKFTKDRLICTWTISVPEGGLVHVEFEDLDIRKHPGCGKGYVQLKNGRATASDNNDNLGSFCGYILPRPVTAKANVMSVDFLSDGSGLTRGFQAKWKTIYPQTIKEPGTTQNETVCGQVFQESRGFISRSSALTNCSWSIAAPKGYSITLSFVYINMVDDPRCRKEQVAIHDGLQNTAPLLRRACGELRPRQVTSSSHNVFIEHTVYEKQQNSRFKIYWKVTSKDDEDEIFNLASCGISTALPTSVINSANQGIGTLPWVVAIMGMFGRVHCGGAIISPEWIISAAHCFERLPWKSLWTVRAGEFDLDTQEASEQDVGTRHLYMHPDYNPETQENDIALLRLKRPLTLNNEVNTICLPETENQLKSGKTCSVAGWGARKYLRQPKEPLTHVLPKIKDIKVCNSSNVYDGRVKDGMLCAGDYGVDSCQGDGGSPLTCKRGDKHYIFGLVSWGNGCAFPGKFGVYTDVRKYLTWMKDVVRSVQK